MMRILVALSLVFGLIAADPIARLSSSLEDSSDEREAQLLPDTLSVVLKLISALIGDNTVANVLVPYVVNEYIGTSGYTSEREKETDIIGVAVSVIKWLVSHALVIALGTVTAIGYCKLTNKCLKFDEIIPVSYLRSYITPENLETAEKFLANAIRRYVKGERLSWTSLLNAILV